ncbi:hypothetical protein C84B14_02441 [Salinisphaera sp. C84B14]|uniref:hypothetical protein n=1 Tax=Salinisphaera sp. C84B14 TaxID=1304155 RepID=UPI0033425D29
MSWSQIALSIFSTVTSFIIWSFLVYVFYVLRNRSLEHKLKQLIQPERSVPDEDRVHIVCANATAVRVTVRDVRLITDDDVHVSLAYIGDTGDVVRPRRPNDIIARRRNPVITRHEKAGLIERNFVELPAQSAGMWALTADQVENPKWHFVECLLVIDYPTLLNTRKLMVVYAKQAIVDSINDDFNRYIVDACRRIQQGRA